MRFFSFWVQGDGTKDREAFTAASFDLLFESIRRKVEVTNDAALLDLVTSLRQMPVDAVGPWDAIDATSGSTDASPLLKTHRYALRLHQESQCVPLGGTVPSRSTPGQQRKQITDLANNKCPGCTPGSA